MTQLLRRIYIQKEQQFRYRLTCFKLINHLNQILVYLYSFFNKKKITISFHLQGTSFLHACTLLISEVHA